jgi:hypothetical protein
VAFVGGAVNAYAVAVKGLLFVAVEIRFEISIWEHLAN